MKARHALGKRDQSTTDVFIEGVRHATSGEFQITTDGFAPYRRAIPNTLEDRCDFAMLVHGPEQSGSLLNLGLAF